MLSVAFVEALVCRVVLVFAVVVGGAHTTPGAKCAEFILVKTPALCALGDSFALASKENRELCTEKRNVWGNE
jgi:hypothetical protein